MKNLSTNSLAVRRLKLLIKKLGGNVINIGHTDNAVENFMTEHEERDSEGREDLGFAPFSSYPVGVLWSARAIVCPTYVPWPELIHEMGHVLACKEHPLESKEFDFLGWEYAVARYIKAPIEEWYENMKNYQVDDFNATHFGDLSVEARDAFLAERLTVAIGLDLVAGDGTPLTVLRN